jgi:hypothetical protein
MLPELIFSILVFAAVFLFLFKSNLPTRWKYLVQQTVSGGLIIWLLASGYAATLCVAGSISWFPMMAFCCRSYSLNEGISTSALRE